MSDFRIVPHSTVSNKNSGSHGSQKDVIQEKDHQANDETDRHDDNSPHGSNSAQMNGWVVSQRETMKEVATDTEKKEGNEGDDANWLAKAQLKGNSSEDIRDPVIHVKTAQFFLHNNVYIVLLNLVTLWTLFASDVALVFFTVQVDSVFDIINTVCLGLFLVDIIFCGIARPSYWCTLYCFLDLLSTFSLVLDIHYLIDTLIPELYNHHCGYSFLFTPTYFYL